MSIIPENNKKDLKRRLQKELRNEVSVKLFTQRASILTIPGRECPYCAQTQQLMEELVELSPKLKLEVFDFYSQREEAEARGVERIPAIVLGADGNSNLKYYGIPAGYEFAAILEGVINISRGVNRLSVETRKALRRVNQPVHMQVFVTPSCPHCPRAAALAHTIALENPLIRADVVEAEEFLSLSQMYGVRSVPLTVINGAIQILGVVAERELVSRVVSAGVKEPAEDEAPSPEKR